MTPKETRKIIRIDEEKCDGCGACVPACAEGALQIVEGKARLVSEVYCDGLGACLGECPRGAISIEERPAEGFDEAAARRHLDTVKQPGGISGGCPSASIISSVSGESSRLHHWPVQLALVPPQAPFLDGADLVLAADCVPFAYANFHRDFLGESSLLVACPKLDDFQAHQNRLTEILRQAAVKSLTVVRMEVPCCSGLRRMAELAREASGKDIPLREVVIDIKGGLKSETDI